MIKEMNRMFQQAGLRFDEDFLNRTFLAVTALFSSSIQDRAYQTDCLQIWEWR